MKSTAVLVAVLVALACFVSQPSRADRKLSVAEAKAIFSGKAFDAHNEKTNADFMVYSAPDGTHNVVYPRTKITGKWSINDKGQGVYHKMNGTKLTHIPENFRDGDKR